MKILLLSILALGAFVFSGCEEKSVLTLKTEPISVEIFARDVSLGITPIELTEKKLKDLNLPLYERIETSPTTHWSTWDSGRKNGTIDVAFRDAPDTFVTLRFAEKMNGSSNIAVSSFSADHEHNEGKMTSTTMTFYLDSRNGEPARPP